MKDPNGNTYKFEYDLAGNCTKTICPDETSISSEYDVRGRLVSETDPSGSKTTYIYDNANQLTSVTDALNNTTLYTYSSTGNLLSVTDANGNVTSYKYDALDRLVSTTLPTGGEITLAYDKEGNVTSSTNLNGVTTTYEYDCNGNLIKEKTGTDTTSYTYTNGLLTEVKKNDESIKYIYNALNQISEKILSDGTSISYNYDTNGNLVKVSTPYTSTSYEYDKLNRIVKVLDRNGNATLYEYDANGNRTAVKYANGITATYTYDSLNRLTKQKLVNANGDNVATYTYTLDKKGNRIKVVDDNTTTQYEYDKLNRLTKETVTQAGTSTVTTYTYDKVGNRLTKTTDGVKTEYTYNSYNQLLSEKNNGLTTSYTYDANGNLLKQSDGTSTSIYTYDAYNRMITATVTKNGSTTKDVYTYDAEGNRLTKTTNGVLTRYIVDSIGLAQVIAELNADGNVTAEYTHGTEVVSQNRSGIVHYYLFDGNGNIRKLTDSTGVVTDTYTYDAFGVTTTSTGVTANPYRYCGEYQDETTGLYYLRARYYDTATGRFTSADSYSGTTSDPVSLHKYLYAHANPVMNSDPTGYFTLFEMSIAMNVQNTLRDTYNSAIIDGFLNFLDTLLGGETDPTALLTSFASGVNTGLVTGALSSGISAMANLSCKLAKASSMLKMGMAGFGFLGSAYSTLQSVEDGNAQQANFRCILTAVSGMGLKRAMGEGMATVNSNCFIAGTLVLTENGNKPIEEIQAGDKVLAENPETGESEYKEVVQVFENETDELIHISINDETITTTPAHPFYVPQRGWISAIDLEAGDILVLSNGEYVTVEQVQHEILEKPVKVYNFEVQDFHTYYVGENSVLVHNLGCGGDRYTKTHYEGKTKVDGIERDTSRDMYLRNDIDWDRIDINTGLTNRELAKKGQAPYANDGSIIELHHLIQQEPGAMVEIPGSLHKKYYSALHGVVGNGESFRNDPILDKQYNNFRRNYWRWRARNLD